MCYRYSVPGPDPLVKRFSASFPEKTSFKRQYHVSSFDLPKLPVITNENPKQIQLFAWGFDSFLGKRYESSWRNAVKNNERSC
jgi:hypothetical protein